MIRPVSPPTLRKRSSAQQRTTPRIPFTICGTGDVFTSVVTGSLLRGESLAKAAALAMQFVSRVMES